MEDVRYWLWVQRTLDYGAKIADLLSQFPSVRAFYEASADDYRFCWADHPYRRLTQQRLEKLMDKDLTHETAITELCARHAVTLLTPDDPRYPSRCKALSDYPAVLFVAGDPSLLNVQHTVSIVGTRRPIRYSFAAAKQISYDLSKRGVVVVSGGALGIDSAAHIGALQASCPTVQVLGGGLLAGGSLETSAVRQKTAQRGAVITEYPPDYLPTKMSFPLRNRLISALSDAVIVVEAGEASGTISTVNHARRQGRKLFIFPGDCDLASFAASRRLIREGETAIFNAEDVLYHMGLPYAGASHPIGVTLEGTGKQPQTQYAKPQMHAPQRRPAEKIANAKKPDAVSDAGAAPPVPPGLSEDAAAAFGALSSGALTYDELLLATKLSFSKLNVALTELTLAGAIKKGADGAYAVHGTSGQ